MALCNTCLAFFERLTGDGVPSSPMQPNSAEAVTYGFSRNMDCGTARENVSSIVPLFWASFPKLGHLTEATGLMWRAT
jgi:hypothetical protein